MTIRKSKTLLKEFDIRCELARQALTQELKRHAQARHALSAFDDAHLLIRAEILKKWFFTQSRVNELKRNITYFVRDKGLQMRSKNVAALIMNEVVTDSWVSIGGKR